MLNSGMNYIDYIALHDSLQDVFDKVGALNDVAKAAYALICAIDNSPGEDLGASAKADAMLALRRGLRHINPRVIGEDLLASRPGV